MLHPAPFRRERRRRRIRTRPVNLLPAIIMSLRIAVIVWQLWHAWADHDCR